MTNKMYINGKEDILLRKLLQFYSNDKYFNIFTEIVQEGKYVSLRLLDYFATNYSKYTRVWLDNVDINNDYKHQLDAYKKQYFDPFCRRKRIYLYRDGEGGKISDHSVNPNAVPILSTTVGQLNFFRWCIERNIIKYIINHYELIESAMTGKSRNKNKQIAIEPIKSNSNASILTTSIKVTVTFS